MSVFVKDQYKQQLKIAIYSTDVDHKLIVKRLMSIPGVSNLTANRIIAAWKALFDKGDSSTKDLT